ncbi:hypothetical protein IKJ53_05860 [bacterium]|nr:hypothetical protein [bacterium]
MITHIQQNNSTNFSGKLNPKKVANGINRVCLTSNAPKESVRVFNTSGLDKALDDFYNNVSKNPKAIVTNIKLAGKALKEGFKVNWNFYFGK